MIHGQHHQYGQEYEFGIEGSSGRRVVKKEKVEEFKISRLLERLPFTNCDIFWGERSWYGCARSVNTFVPNINISLVLIEFHWWFIQLTFEADRTIYSITERCIQVMWRLQEVIFRFVCWKFELVMKGWQGAAAISKLKIDTLREYGWKRKHIWPNLRNIINIVLLHAMTF